MNMCLTFFICITPFARRICKHSFNQPAHKEQPLLVGDSRLFLFQIANASLHLLSLLEVNSKSSLKLRANGCTQPYDAALRRAAQGFCIENPFLFMFWFIQIDTLALLARNDEMFRLRLT